MGWFDRPDLDGMYARADVQGLIRVLDDGSEAEQITAGEMLIRLGIRRGFDHLIEILGTGGESARIAAAEVLGELKATQAVDSLAITLEDPSEKVQQAAWQALLAIDTVQAQQALAEWDRAKAEPDADLQTFAYDHVMGSNRLPGARRILKPAMRQTAAQEEFILANRYQEEERTLEALTAIDKVLVVDPAWADALNLRGILHEEMGVPFAALNDYRKAALYDPLLAEARTNLEEMMRELNLPAIPVQEWLDQLESDTWEERRDAYVALSFSRHPAALPALLNGLQDEDVEVITAVIEAIEGMDDPVARAALEENYQDMQGSESDMDLFGFLDNK